jgi:hypothetical protein
VGGLTTNEHHPSLVGAYISKMSHGISGKSSGKPRRTLLERASEVHIRDPAQHTRHQVAELDKQAKSSIMRKKLQLDQIEADTKEIAFIDDEIKRIHERSVHVHPL